MPASATSSTRILSVHYLRAVAALMVVLYHVYSYHLSIADHGRSVLWLKEGVAIFFAISGFVMVSSTGRTEIGPAQFLWKRAKRIVPLYWLTTLCVVVGNLPEWRHIIASLFFIPLTNPQTGMIDPPLVDVGWTLNFEMAFYLLFAISMLLPRRVSFWTLTGGLVALSASGLVFDYRPSFIAYYGQSFLLDFVAGLLIAHFRIRLSAYFLPIGFLLLALMPQVTEIRLLSATLPAASILASALSLDRKLPRWGWLTLLGDSSYAIYLSHLFVVIGFLSLWGVDHGGTLVAMTTLLISALVGILMHRQVELPLKALIESAESRLRPIIAKHARPAECRAIPAAQGEG